MADLRWQRTWQVFHEALELPPRERAAFVASACGGDRGLQDEVMMLLDAHESDHAFLETPAPLVAGADTPPEDEAGTRIGPYVIRRVLGRGGMGIVYEADHEGGVERRVALKLVRAGMASREILARFAAERQALVLMNHPNIATAYDVGMSDDGRPYFAMELVDGQPLTRYCDAGALPIRERLDLFLQVCDAVQHAHLKGILHRDLKPSNVLAGRDQDRTVLKVIDFGIAKAVTAGGDGLTRAGRLFGTPEYMSPEQAGVMHADVDTRADIYSLGVMLYELLAGVPPVDPDRLRSASFGTVERLLFVDDLPPPSARAPHAALSRQLRGELDWIIGRAMEKDRARRYQSVSEFAADVRRYLAHEPVLAGPPDASYRIRKFVRRHRAGVAAMAALLVVTATFVAGLVRSNAETRRALQEAGIERERSNQVTSFLVNLFRVSKPSTAQANAVTARELLDKGAADIRSQLGTQPVVQARLMETMGEVYTNLGLLDQAETLLTDSLDVRRRTLGSNHREVADTLARLGRLHVSQGKYKEALARHREALAIYRGEATPDLLSLAMALLNEGGALRSVGDIDAAEKSLREGLELFTRINIQEEGYAETLKHLGGIAMSRGDLATAEQYRRQAAELRLRMHGEGHIEVARARNDLAVVLFQQRDDATAEVIYRQVLATYESVLGSEHADVASIKNNLGAVLVREGKLDEAEPFARDAVAIRRRQSGDRHPEVAVALHNLATLLRAKGDPASAVAILREALGIMREAYGASHPNVTATLVNLGEALHEAGAPDAEATLAEALEARRKTFPPANPNVAVSIGLVAHARAERGDAIGAEPLLRDAVASIEKTGTADNPRLIQARAYLGGVLADLGKRAEAEPILKDCQARLGKSAMPHDRAYVAKKLEALARSSR